MDKIKILEFPEKTLLTRRETASVLNVSLANFDASISKKLERIEIGRRVYCARDSIEKFLGECTNTRREDENKKDEQ